MSADNELERLRAEVERLHSWAGLLLLLDEHWPEDIFPTEPDSEGRDPGPRIVSLLRWVERLRAELAEGERIRSKLKQTIDAFPDARDAANLAHARAQRDMLHAAIADVRRLQELTIAASCRVQAIDQATDTLAVLDRALGVPETPDGES